MANAGLTEFGCCGRIVQTPMVTGPSLTSRKSALKILRRQRDMSSLLVFIPEHLLDPVKWTRQLSRSITIHDAFGTKEKNCDSAAGGNAR